MALTLSSAQTSVAEGGALAFTVAATADDNKTLFKPLSWVVLDEAGGIAASGDFAAASGALSPINHGKTSRDFVVTALADTLFEGGAETYTVQVRSDSVAGIPLSGTLEATVTFAVQVYSKRRGCIARSLCATSRTNAGTSSFVRSGGISDFAPMAAGDGTWAGCW